ncbi:MAG: hypothetical protein U9N42_04970 [Campylobacterota bacterium]|nr:hypothetical protein [Campylobacterota bacterium]
MSKAITEEQLLQLVDILGVEVSNAIKCEIDKAVTSTTCNENSGAKIVIKNIDIKEINIKIVS